MPIVDSCSLSCFLGKWYCPHRPYLMINEANSIQNEVTRFRRELPWSANAVPLLARPCRQPSTPTTTRAMNPLPGIDLQLQHVLFYRRVSFQVPIHCAQRLTGERTFRKLHHRTHRGGRLRKRELKWINNPRVARIGSRPWYIRSTTTACPL